MKLNLGKLLVVAVALVSTAAWAGPMSLWLGQTKFISYNGRFTKATVSNPSVVAVETLKGGAEVRAKVAGVSRVSLRSRDGEKFEFDVHVTPRGAEVYSTNRAEPEHGEFSLSTAPAVSRSSAVASKAFKSKLRTAKRVAGKASGPRA
jgi:hypothetical protein